MTGIFETLVQNANRYLPTFNMDSPAISEGVCSSQ
jgi:hypothetical protein